MSKHHKDEKDKKNHKNDSHHEKKSGHESKSHSEESKKHTSHKEHKENSSHTKKKAKHAVKRTIKKQSSGNLWMWVSVILAVALVVSINSDLLFEKNSVDEAIEEIDSLIMQTESADAKASLEAMKSELTDLKLVLTPKEEPKDTGKDSEKDGEKDPENSGSDFSGDKVKLDFYVMSQCPYGTQVVDAIAPVKKQLGDSLDLNIEYIFYPKTQYAGREAQFCVGDLCGMHGVPEVKGNIVQLCAMEHEPEKYLDMLTCQNKNARAIPDNWEACAKDNGLDVEKIRSCYEGDEGVKLATESSARAQEVKASGSPTIFLNDAAYNGARGTTDFLRSVCNAFENERPDACADIPEPVKVEMIVVNDENCKTCDTTQIVGVTTQLFPGAKVRNVDASSAEGKELIEKYGLVLAPAYLFDMKLEETETWKVKTNIRAAFEKTNDMYKLADSQTGASFYFDEEKQKEALEKPRKALGLTEGGKPQMDFFVMSFCPYGIQAENGIIPAEKVLGDDVKFVPHFVIYPSGSGCKVDTDGTQYCSMHGAGELNEDIRQMCIYEEQQDKFFPYIEAIANDYNARKVSDKDIDSKWKTYAEAVGVDVAAVEACFNDDEKVLPMLRKEMELNSLLGVRGSPSIFINGNQFSGGRTATAYQNALCAEFDENSRPEACGAVIESAPTAEVPAGSCG